MDTPTNPDPTRYLDPATLEAIGSMSVRARALAEGVIAGLHRSHHRGGAVEFAEYAKYTPGHEIRHIDWKVFAKSDRYYVKKYEDETNLRAYLAIDGSGSMDFAGPDASLTKARYASFLAATLAYLLIRQGDAVGALVFDDGARRFLPASARAGHLTDLFALLDELVVPGAPTALGAALSALAERAKRRSLALIFSDLLDADEEVARIIRTLRARRLEVALFHIIDDAELELPYEGITQFKGCEGEDPITADPDELRASYKELMRAHIERAERAASDAGAGYLLCRTSEPVERAALAFLRGRA